MKVKKNNIEEIMKNLEQPSIDVSKHQSEFRLALLNTKKSAITGVFLLILPLLFLSGVVLKHYMQIDLGILTSVYEWIGEIDHRYGDRSILNWAIRALLIIGPLAAIAINLLAVSHFRVEKARKEIVLSFKMKFFNWLIILICSTVFAIFFLYLIGENA